MSSTWRLQSFVLLGGFPEERHSYSSAKCSGHAWMLNFVKCFPCMLDNIYLFKISVAMFASEDGM